MKKAETFGEKAIAQAVQAWKETTKFYRGDFLQSSEVCHRKKSTIGLIVPDISTTQYAEFLEGFCNTLKTHNKQWLLVQSDNITKLEYEFLTCTVFKGAIAIMMLTSHDTLELKKKLGENNEIPVLLVNLLKPSTFYQTFKNQGTAYANELLNRVSIDTP